MAKYANHVANPKTPQTKRAKSTQVKGRAGGYVFTVDPWTRLNRFLIMGCEKGSYYASDRELTIENYDCILECLKLDAKRTVDTIVEISDKGRAVKNDPAIFALAVCSVHGDVSTKEYANKVMPKVARFSTAFFTWVDAVVTLKEGRKGKGLLRAIGRWYTEKDADKLAYQVCKYPGRSIGGKRWTHADALRLARISPSKDGKPSRNGKALTIPSDNHAKIFNYVTHGVTSSQEAKSRLAEERKTGKKQRATGVTKTSFNYWKSSKLKYVWAHEKAKVATSVSKIVELIEKYKLTRESIPPQFRNELEVQRALLPTMPMTALIRNLGQMTSSGLLKSLSDETALVIDKITNEEAIKRSRLHPMTIMMALKTYGHGSGMRTTWKPVSAIKDALEEAFYKSFSYVEPTGKKFLFGIDVSGSMENYWYHRGVKSAGELSPREAAAVIAMTCARTEKNYEMMGFSHEFVKLNITAKDSLETVVRRISNLPFQRTDCSLPMEYAIKEKLDVDMFVVLTDHETYAGARHPFEALKAYRKEFKKDSKLAVLAFDASNFTIADPSDAGMMDIAGLDSNVPKILSEFAADQL
jgi:60 kDa SS-A/Ro ribonucleoprotein